MRWNAATSSVTPLNIHTPRECEHAILAILCTRANFREGFGRNLFNLRCKENSDRAPPGSIFLDGPPSHQIIVNISVSTALRSTIALRKWASRGKISVVRRTLSFLQYGTSARLLAPLICMPAPEYAGRSEKPGGKKSSPRPLPHDRNPDGMEQENPSSPGRSKAPRATG